MNRRGFIKGLSGFLAAPAIGRAARLMPVSSLPPPDLWTVGPRQLVPTWNEVLMVTLRNRSPHLATGIVENNALLARLNSSQSLTAPLN